MSFSEDGNPLNLPEAPVEIFQDASEAVKKEFRKSIQWKELKALKITTVKENLEEQIFIIHVGHLIEFEWTWEGAIAFRPEDSKYFQDQVEKGSDSVDPLDDSNPDISWTGEVVEVDETTGRLYVTVSDPEKKPRTGIFFVRPFEFLRSIHAIYSDGNFAKVWGRLIRSLQATCGGIHPAIKDFEKSSLEEVKSSWGSSWGLIWGPPGTGKTFLIGKQVAKYIQKTKGRILVISTTNKATDEAAFSIGRACKALLLKEVEEGSVLRIGRGANYKSFKHAGLLSMLKETETDILQKINELKLELHLPRPKEEKAEIRRAIKELTKAMRDSADRIFTSPEKRVIVCTSFKALSLISGLQNDSCLTEGKSGFHTVIVDEAGLISRAAAAVLSLLATERVLFVGDPKQLAPITKVSRLLPSKTGKWLSKSTLSHLKSRLIENGATMLKKQYRMHSQIRKVVSLYQYENLLIDAPDIENDKSFLPGFLKNQPRAIWYILDESNTDIHSIRAARGPGNRSWIRPATKAIIKGFFADPDFRFSQGLFLSPFKAQASAIAGFFSESGLVNWTASTIHSQQGAEADYVLFDTVNAGSTAWDTTEWRRLINVALSRAKKMVLVLASRAEMNEPYTAPLKQLLPGMTMKKGPEGDIWQTFKETHPYEGILSLDPNSEKLGDQIILRKMMRPVFSYEQQRLCGLEMDGKPRLIRGVAGSGKTLVLAHWVHKVMLNHIKDSEYKIWIVYANKTLKEMIEEALRAAAIDECTQILNFENRIEMHHIRQILDDLLSEFNQKINKDNFDYDDHAKKYQDLKRGEAIIPRCDSMFIDEAQDMGANTLSLLAQLVKPSDPENPNSRSISIFYDNAQNIYGRSTPKWIDMGIDMRGRSTILKESFRSTKPICEFALNLLFRLQPPEKDIDYKELIKNGLIEQTQRNDQTWWNVHFNQVNGPIPEYQRFAKRNQEMDAIAGQLIELIDKEGVDPKDICIIYNGHHILNYLIKSVNPKLKHLKTSIKPFNHNSKTDASFIIATTTHSFKGFDSEIVLVAGTDQFITGARVILANVLYVAMTRARSILKVFATKGQDYAAGLLHNSIDGVLNQMTDNRRIQKDQGETHEIENIVLKIGEQYRPWIQNIFGNHPVSQDFVYSPEGEILCEPVFHFKKNDRQFVCFGSKIPPSRILYKLENHGIQIIKPGESF